MSQHAKKRMETDEGAVDGRRKQLGEVMTVPVNNGGFTFKECNSCQVMINYDFNVSKK